MDGDCEVSKQSEIKKQFLTGLNDRVPLYVEILKKNKSDLSKNVIHHYVEKLVGQIDEIYSQYTPVDFTHVPQLHDHVKTICIYNDNEESDSKAISVKEACVNYRTYQLHYDGPAIENFDNNCDLAAAQHWLLPAAEFHGMWENLIYDCNIKHQLLSFATTTLLFSDKKVDNNVISWNRVILLHGPPGTGKTSLCKALAQKLFIRLNHRYTYGQLIEINSHSLFSKWFSESGKLVMKMFEKIHEFLGDPNALVFVLIDEIESLAHARKTVASGNEPSDAIRVVNAVLTQIDAIKQYPNVLILTTSNITGAIDLALVDRADIKQFIGLPSPRAIYKIYESCIEELIRTGIIKIANNKMNHCGSPSGDSLSFQYLKEISEKSVGLSGRTLRKLPLLAHALFIQKPTTTVSEFLEALSKAVKEQFQQNEDLVKS